jgi:hypothetical protein
MWPTRVYPKNWSSRRNRDQKLESLSVGVVPYGNAPTGLFYVAAKNRFALPCRVNQKTARGGGTYKVIVAREMPNAMRKQRSKLRAYNNFLV